MNTTFIRTTLSELLEHLPAPLERERDVLNPPHLLQPHLRRKVDSEHREEKSNVPATSRENLPPWKDCNPTENTILREYYQLMLS